MLVQKIIASASAGFLIGAGAALGDEVQLTAAEQTSVTDACRLGLPLIPVESDYGYETGQYALPIATEDGQVNSALIVNEAVLEGIPECRAEIQSLAEAREQSDERIS